MLSNLHVKNLALIREADIDFGPKLNILTGETGAGKSIIIDSVLLALGGKLDKNILREDAPYSLAELTFTIENEKTGNILEEKGVTLEDGNVVVSRKITKGKSTIRINGETFSVTQTREIADKLINVYAQNEFENLLHTDRQLAMLDEFGGREIGEIKSRLAIQYGEHKEILSKIDSLSMSDEERQRNIDLLKYEINEIENAAIKEGEDEEIEVSYKKMLNSQKIAEAVNEAHHLSGNDIGGAADLIGNAVRALSAVKSIDPDTERLYQSYVEIDSLLSDINREMADYGMSLSFSSSELESTERRYNEINHLKAKYGNSLEDVNAALQAKKDKLEALEGSTEELQRLKTEAEASRAHLELLCDELSDIRGRFAKTFAKNVKEELQDLNFNQVDLKIEMNKKPEITSGGRDDIEFVISMNPGEPLRPLRKVASGGELSRIMLGIKSMIAGLDDAGTMIFDEIDAGISGRTAQKVAEKLKKLGKSKQILSVTHLPQIAAMADDHFEVSKDVESGTTSTNIRHLDHEGSVNELARMLGGAVITDQTISAAGEMKQMSEHLL